MEILPNWHPILVHFTIALYAISALFFVLGHIGVKNEWAQKLTTAAYLNLWLGALITLLTVAAGIYAYNTVSHDDPSHIAMTNHKDWALATAAFFWIVAIWSVFKYRAGKPTGTIFVIAMIIGAGLIATTGYKGGEIVYRYGLGVLSLPQAEGAGHQHSHDSGANDHEHNDHNDDGTDDHQH